MSNRRDCSLVALALCGLIGSACLDARPPNDIGEDWIGGPSTEAISWMAWSPDGATLYWIAGREPETLYAAKTGTMGSRSPIVMATGVWSFPSPTLAAGGRTLFYMAPDPAPAPTADPESHGGALIEATITGDGTALADAHTVANDVFSYRPTDDGTRVAFISYSTGKSTIRNLATDASLDLAGYPDPTTFTPDGQVLFARNAAASDEATHYLLVDATTGATTNLSFPSNRLIDLVLAWEGQRPRVVLADADVIDLQGGSSLRLAGVGRVDALSSSQGRVLAYGWGDVDCLDPHTEPELGQVCSAFYYRLSRDDVSTGAHDVVAAEVVERDNNVDTAVPSPDGARLAVAAGSGLLVGQARTSIKLKRLSLP